MIKKCLFVVTQHKNWFSYEGTGCAALIICSALFSFLKDCTRELVKIGYFCKTLLLE